MEMRIFSIFDKKTNVYGRPFFAVNNGSAIRSISDEMERPESALGRHPSDYCICSLGSYDDLSGSIDPENVVVVMECSQLVKGDEDGERN